MDYRVTHLIHREWGHPNLTIVKAVKFGAGYLLVLPVGLGLLWVLTEKVGLWYIASSVISGCIVAGLRFVLSAVFAFKQGKEAECKND